MQVRNAITMAAGLLAAVPLFAGAQTPAQPWRLKSWLPSAPRTFTRPRSRAW